MSKINNEGIHGPESLIPIFTSSSKPIKYSFILIFFKFYNIIIFNHTTYSILVTYHPSDQTMIIYQNLKCACSKE